MRRCRSRGSRIKAATLKRSAPASAARAASPLRAATVGVAAKSWWERMTVLPCWWADAITDCIGRTDRNSTSIAETQGKAPSRRPLLVTVDKLLLPPSPGCLAVAMTGSCQDLGKLAPCKVSSRISSRSTERPKEQARALLVFKKRNPAASWIVPTTRGLLQERMCCRFNVGRDIVQD